MNRALFLDRDGIINELVYYESHGEWESPRSVEDLQIRAGVTRALVKANRAGWQLFIISNQPSYAKGKCSLESLQHVHETVLQRLAASGVKIADSYVCYHHPTSTLPGFGACECRKPSPFFLREAAARYDIDLERSWMIGDQDSDIETGRRAGCRTALIPNARSAAKRGNMMPDLVCTSLDDFLDQVRGEGEGE